MGTSRQQKPQWRPLGRMWTASRGWSWLSFWCSEFLLVSCWRPAGCPLMLPWCLVRLGWWGRLMAGLQCPHTGGHPVGIMFPNYLNIRARAWTVLVVLAPPWAFHLLLNPCWWLRLVYSIRSGRSQIGDIRRVNTVLVFPVLQLSSWWHTTCTVFPRLSWRTSSVLLGNLIDANVHQDHDEAGSEERPDGGVQDVPDVLVESALWAAPILR